MLYKQTVSPATLELLKRLMNEPLLDNFFLVGGTALSFQIGHRISIDLDFFTTSDFDANGLVEEIEAKYGFQLDYQQKNTIKGRIDDVKVDFIAHQYPVLEDLLNFEGIRMTGLRDIAAMKLNAIAGKGTRVKHFIDVAYLSSYLTPLQILEAYQDKYVNRNPLMAVKSLIYHQDIDFSEPIEMMDKNYAWQFVEKRLNDMLAEPEKLFEALGFVNPPENDLKRR
jgi:nucleotidyltransferase AbiEii toxin of type IV toxin-antitoxin system